MIKFIKIRKMDFKVDLNLTQITRSRIFQASLGHLSLEVEQGNEISKETQMSLKFNFSRDENSHGSFEGFWFLYYFHAPWFFPLIFLYMIFYFWVSFASFFIQKQVIKSPINEDLRYWSRQLPFMYEYFNSFSKLQLISLASIVFLYTSFWHLKLVLFVVILELIAETVIWLLPILLLEKYFKFVGSPREIFFGPLAVILADILLRDYNRQKYTRKDLVELLVALLAVLMTLMYPSSLMSAHWALAIGAIWCSTLTRYQNPCALDYFSWVIFFGFFITFEFLHITCYLAIGYKTSFLEAFFKTWISLIGLKWQSALFSLIFMAFGILLDFTLIKSNVYRLLFPAKIKASQAIRAKQPEHRSGMLNFPSREQTYLRSPLLSGSYYLEPSEQNQNKLAYRRDLKRTSSKSDWHLQLNFRNQEQHYILERVVYQGEEQGHLMGILTKTSLNGLQLSVLNLRTKRVIFTSTANKFGQEIFFQLGSKCPPKVVQIRRDRHILIFFGCQLTQFWNPFLLAFLKKQIIQQLFFVFDLKTCKILRFVRKNKNNKFIFGVP